jgi:hypothetical protein
LCLLSSPLAYNLAMDDQEQDNQTPQPTPAREPVGPNYWKKPKPGKLVYFAILIIVAAAAAGAYWFLVKPQPAKTSQSNQAAAVQAPAISSKTDHYDSNNFGLGFDYPQGWTIADTAGSGKLTVASPTIKLKNASGQMVNGQIIMTIRDKTQKLTEFDKGAALAVRDSEKIAYARPSQIQRGSTYVSFLQYSTTADGNSLDAIYITGDNGYQKNQTIPLTDVSKSDPVIGISFIRCSDAKCSNISALSLSQNVWDDSSFSKPLKSLLESLIINR